MLLRPCWFEQHESGLLPPNFGAKYAVKQRRTTSVTYLVYHFLVNQLGGGQVSWQAWLATPRTLFTFSTMGPNTLFMQRRVTSATYLANDFVVS